MRKLSKSKKIWLEITSIIALTTGGWVGGFVSLNYIPEPSVQHAEQDTIFYIKEKYLWSTTFYSDSAATCFSYENGGAREILNTATLNRSRNIESRTYQVIGSIDSPGKYADQSLPVSCSSGDVYYSTSRFDRDSLAITGVAVGAITGVTLYVIIVLLWLRAGDYLLMIIGTLLSRTES